MSLGSLLLTVQVVVQAPCSLTPWVNAELPSETALGQSVGQLTVSVLEDSGLPFVGYESGIASIGDTPTGEAAMEILSDREMRAYGWCYQVNGEEPALYPHQIFVEAPTDTIEWFFGYARYLDGEWVEACVPTHETQPAYLCAD